MFLRILLLNSVAAAPRGPDAIGVHSGMFLIRANGDKTQMNEFVSRIAAPAIALLSLSLTASAGGLRTPFGEVVIRNLRIGQTYSMYKLVNLPLRVVNTGGETTDIRIETVRASAVVPGYEPI